MSGLDNLDVELAVMLGKTCMPLRQLLKLGRGAVVALDGNDGDTVEILANGHPIARGEVLVSSGTISVKIREMVRKPVELREPGARIGGGFSAGAGAAASAGIVADAA